MLNHFSLKKQTWKKGENKNGQGFFCFVQCFLFLLLLRSCLRSLSKLWTPKADRFQCLISLSLWRQIFLKSKHVGEKAQSNPKTKELSAKSRVIDKPWQSHQFRWFELFYVVLPPAQWTLISSLYPQTIVLRDFDWSQIQASLLVK